MATAKSPALTRRQSAWLFAAALAAFLPLTPHLPAWLSATAALVLSWRGLLLVERRALPPRWLLLPLAVIGAASVGIYYHTLFGRSPGISLLVLLFAMKTLETRTARDGFALVLLGYFLVVTQFFFTQQIANGAMMLGVVALLTTALLIINHERQTGARSLGLAASLLAQSMPLMLLLFVLFPRITGPLWGLPIEGEAGITGLSNTMTPGAISRLALSDAIAFRAKFRGTPPPQRLLYWRGPVLDSFDGRTWQPGESSFRSAPPNAAGHRAVNYTVTIEPDDKPWLFALDLPGAIPPNAVMTTDDQLLARTPVRSRLRYRMHSYLGAVDGADASASTLEAALELPPGVDPRARALARTWRTKFGSDRIALIGHMLDYYRREAFTYTLNPPPLGANSVDQFLFDTRRGFCEHFASSFVFMMRAAGIPARVVTGYQGGEMNPINHTLIVRQFDAHAWAEVWLKGRGWVRVDPTAAVAPSRIEKGLAAALPQDSVLPFLERPDFLWLQELRFGWDALTNGWNQWVLGYDEQRQRRFLSSFGMLTPDWPRMSAALTTLACVVLALFMFWSVRVRQRQDPPLAAWNRLSRKLARRGIARRPWEGPLDYAERVAAELPHAGPEVRRIAGIYEELRYAGQASRARLAELKWRIRRFSP